VGFTLASNPIGRKRLPGTAKKHIIKREEKFMKRPFLRLALAVIVASLWLPCTGVSASETDQRIESSAKQSYVFKTFLKDGAIEVQSKDGAVTLTGTVSEESHKGLAGDTVASLPGVKSVDNKLALKGEIPAVPSDAWLMAKVKTTLLFHRNVSATGTEVMADDGAVTLRGQAASTAQKDLVTEYALDVDGVKTVSNEMTVAPAATQPNEKTVGEKIDAIKDSIDDASITALVKTTLLYHRSTSGLNTTVETKDGVVTLKGNVKNGAEKDLTTKIVNDVHGVKRVINTMTIT
jgi:osmotically-inducible protein OsmY